MKKSVCVQRGLQRLDQRTATIYPKGHSARQPGAPVPVILHRLLAQWKVQTARSSLVTNHQAEIIGNRAGSISQHFLHSQDYYNMHVDLYAVSHSATYGYIYSICKRIQK